VNIFLVSNGFPPQALGGVETYTYDLSRSLTQAGHAITVFCRQADYSLPDYHISDSLEEGIRVIRIVNDHKQISSFQGTFVDERIETIFRQYLLDVSPDLVHFNHLISLSARLPDIAEENHIPGVITLHDFWPLCQRVNLIDWQGNICMGPAADGENCAVCVVGGESKVKLANAMQWFTRLVKSMTSSSTRNRMRQSIPGGSSQPPLLRSTPQIFQDRRRLFLGAVQKAGRILAPSNYVKDNYLANGYEQTIEVLPLGINLPAEVSLRTKREDWSLAPIVFSAIGSFIPHKGFDTLIDAFMNVTGENLRLNLYGGSMDSRSAYYNQMREIAEHDRRIIFKGAFSPQQRGEIFKSIDILVVPSRWESYSLVCREALMSGIPVIASRISPLTDVVIDQENGYLFDPENVEQLTAILKKIAGNPAILAKLNCPGPVSIPTQQTHVEAMVGIYHQVIGSYQHP